MQEMQQREHDAVAAISRTLEARKKEFLLHLSGWLLAQRADHSSHAEINALCGCSMREWTQLQAEASKLEAEVSSLEREVANAHAAYRAEEPLGGWGLGVIGEMMGSEEKRRKLQALHAVTVQTTGALNGAKSRLQQNVEKRQQFGKRFLRACLESIRRLETSQVFGPAVQTQIKEMNSSIQSEWARYESYSRGAMESASSNLDGLKSTYFGGGRNG